MLSDIYTYKQLHDTIHVEWLWSLTANHLPLVAVYTNHIIGVLFLSSEEAI